MGVVGLDQFDQDAAGAAGVEERDPVAPGPRAGLGVDELDAFLLESAEFGLEVGGPVGDVMEARPAPGQEPAHGGVGMEGFEEFYGAAERRADALALQDLHLGTGVAGQELEEAGSLGDGRHGDGHVIEWQRAGSEYVHTVLHGGATVWGDAGGS